MGQLHPYRVFFIKDLQKSPVGTRPTPSERGFLWHLQPTYLIPNAFTLF